MYAVLEVLKQLFPEPKTILNYSNDVEFLIAVMLSAQTTDIQVNKVTEKLFQKYKTLKQYVEVELEEFQKDIGSVNLYRTKGKNILQTIKMLDEKYQGKIPQTVEQLIEFPGVGRKTANVVLAGVYGISEGIAVDTHVARLSQKFGLTEETDPKKIEKDLMEILPKEEWGDFTLRMIEYGRKYSAARKKETGDDPISIELNKLVIASIRRLAETKQSR